MGSCVSRDVFEIANNERFAIEWYYARSSVISLVSKPLEFSEMIDLSSEFQKRMVLSDLNKFFWETIKNDTPDYIMIDFIDERYAIAKSGGSYFTLSDEFKESHCISDYTIIEREKEGNEFFIEGVSLAVYLDEFIDRLKSSYPEEKIILHKAKLKDFYVSVHGEVIKFSDDYCKYIENINNLLGYMYTYMERKIKGCISIECTEDFCADEGHKWGLDPMHYEEKYYIAIYNSLCENVS